MTKTDGQSGAEAPEHRHVDTGWLESQWPKTSAEIAIEFVAMRRNLHELPSLRRLAYELQARSIIITGVLPYTPELAEETLLWVPGRHDRGHPRLLGARDRAGR